MTRGFYKGHKISCDECGIEITWTPVVIEGRTYCCHDCAVGLECDCGRLNSPADGNLGRAWMEDLQSNLEYSPRSDYSFD